jgi:putative nucleotidyltransferase with HDIG domain
MINKKQNHLRLVTEAEKEPIVSGLLDIVARLTIKNQEQFTDIVKIILKSLEEKDSYTKGHSLRVTEYSLMLGKAYGLDKDSLEQLELTSLLHDIGKIGIPDKILKKPGRLTKDEFDSMKDHPVKSAEMLSDISSLKRIAPYVKAHHERFDGKGYPEGLKGQQIPLFARILLIADTFDAMTSNRPYRKGLDFEATIQELRKCSGTQFDPELVEIFINCINKESIDKAA